MRKGHHRPYTATRPGTLDTPLSSCQHYLSVPLLPPTTLLRRAAAWECTLFSAGKQLLLKFSWLMHGTSWPACYWRLAGSGIVICSRQSRLQISKFWRRSCIYVAGLTRKSQAASSTGLHCHYKPPAQRQVQVVLVGTCSMDLPGCLAAYGSAAIWLLLLPGSKPGRMLCTQMCSHSNSQYMIHLVYPNQVHFWGPLPVLSDIPPANVAHHRTCFVDELSRSG